MPKFQHKVNPSCQIRCSHFFVAIFCTHIAKRMATQRMAAKRMAAKDWLPRIFTQKRKDNKKNNKKNVLLGLTGPISCIPESFSWLLTQF